MGQKKINNTRSLEKIDKNQRLTAPSKKLKSKLEFILDLVGRGMNRQQVIERIEEKFEISSRSASDMYGHAMKWLQVSSDEERNYLREKHQSMLMGIYRRCIESGDFKEAHNILNTINKMYGLNQAEKSNPTSLFEFKFNLAGNDPINNPTIDLNIDQISIVDSGNDDGGDDEE